MRWFVREYHDDDLEPVVRLLDTTSARQGSVFGLSEVIDALRDDQPAMLALRDDEVVGVVVSSVSGDRASVTRLAMAESWRGQGMASALLLGLERILVDLRVRVLSYVLPEEEQLAEGLANAGFTREDIDRLSRLCSSAARGPRPVERTLTERQVGCRRDLPGLVQRAPTRERERVPGWGRRTMREERQEPLAHASEGGGLAVGGVAGLDSA
jgi:N-acetylglutamate synthase-like GNAT family acetyltransferase